MFKIKSFTGTAIEFHSCPNKEIDTRPYLRNKAVIQNCCVGF